MSPPNLPTDAPVLNVREPLSVNFFPMPGKETNEMFFYDRECFLRFRITEEPLLAQSRLDRHVAAIAKTDVVFVRLSLREKMSILQKVGCSLARFETVEPI